MIWILAALASVAALAYLFRRPLGRQLKRWLKLDIPPLPPGCN